MLEVFLLQFALLYTLWIFYLAVMNLARAKNAGKISKPALFFGLPVLYVGYLLDFLTNVLVFTPFMLDLPKETTVTTRLKRYAHGPAGWRKSFALWFAKDMLDDYDPSGKHV